MKTTIMTKKGYTKDLDVRIWSKPNCLYCGQPLPEDTHMRRNSANYIRSLHIKCAAQADSQMLIKL